MSAESSMGSCGKNDATQFVKAGSDTTDTALRCKHESMLVVLSAGHIHALLTFSVALRQMATTHIESDGKCASRIEELLW